MGIPMYGAQAVNKPSAPAASTFKQQPADPPPTPQASKVCTSCTKSESTGWRWQFSGIEDLPSVPLPQARGIQQFEVKHVGSQFELKHVGAQFDVKYVGAQFDVKRVGAQFENVLWEEI